MGAIRVQDCAPTRALSEGPQLQLYVVYTSPDATRAALRVACLYARDLGARIRLLAPSVVPYPRPLEDPAVSAAVTEARLTSLARECDVGVEVQVLLCRAPEDVISRWLPPACVAIIGRAHRWGRGGYRALIRAARGRGRQVFVVHAAETELPVVRSS